jgi:serine/threonine protein kinase
MLVMERARCSLWDLFQTHEPSARSKHTMICWLVEAVQWIHWKGWRHNDIKPHNILVRADRRLALCDMGMACRLSELPTIPAHVGTSVYLPPEDRSRDLKARGKSEHADNYAVGVTIMQIVHPCARMKHVDPRALLDRVQLPYPYDAVVCGLMQTDPAQRMCLVEAIGLLSRW